MSGMSIFELDLFDYFYIGFRRLRQRKAEALRVEAVFVGIGLGFNRCCLRGEGHLRGEEQVL